VRSLPRVNKFIILTSLLLCRGDFVYAKTELRICSQNLQRVGKAPFGRGKESVYQQTNFLVQRMISAECDIVAVQEVYGKSKGEAAGYLQNLSSALSQKAGDKFTSLVGESQFDEIRNGFIVRESTGRLLSSNSTPDYYLPKLNPLQRTRAITRKPFAILLDVAESKTDLLLVDIHLKSKVGGFKDTAGLDFETLRMESAEQIREFTNKLTKESPHPKEIITMILGDRNSEPGSATDMILQGRLTLNDFKGRCGVDSSLEPTCEPIRNSVFEPALSQVFKSGKLKGSTKYRGREQLIDEIYINSSAINDLRLRKKLNVGIEGEFFKGSDHKLIWIDLPL
jgi:hypothetical protein